MTPRVTVRERRAIPYNDGAPLERRWFNVFYDRPYKRVSAVLGGWIPENKILCADHGIDEECECKAAIRSHLAGK